MNRRTWGFILLITGLLCLGAVLVAMAAEKKTDKRETKAYIGIVPGELTSDLAQQYGVKSGAGGGVLVEDVSSGSPASEAGLRENDVITSLNGKSITGPQEFRNQISKMKPGDEVELAYLRGGAEHTVKVKLGERENNFSFNFPNFNHQYRMEGQPWDWQQAKPGDKVAYAGLLTEDLSKGLAGYFKVDKGALINEVMKDSPAEKAGLKAGDIITKIGDKAVESEGDVRRAIHDHKPGDAVDFVVVRDGKEETEHVTLGEQTMHTETGDLFHLEHDSIGGLTLVPDQMEIEKLKEHLNDLKLNMNGLGDSLRLYMKNIEIPPIHINVDEWSNEPIHHMHKVIRTQHDTATV